MTASSHPEIFTSTLADVEAMQRCLLRKMLAINVEAEYGRAHQFVGIDNVTDYQNSVPLVDYEDIRPYIDRMVDGETSVLTTERVAAYFQTSGTLTKPKLLPVTASLMRQKVATFAIYWEQVYKDYPATRDGRLVSNFSDASSLSRTKKGIEICSESNFWSRRGRMLASMNRWPLPREIKEIKDRDIRLYVIARLLLQSELHCIMCLNPSTLLQFCQTFSSASANLAEGLERGTWGRDLVSTMLPTELSNQLDKNQTVAQTLRQAVHDKREPSLAELWPDLELVICWSSKIVQPYFEQLSPWLGDTPVRDYISQSSECMMAIPRTDGSSGGTLAYTTHFFEFIPIEFTTENQPLTLCAWQLELDQLYELVVTTGGGLYRYRTGDCFQVTGYEQSVPQIEFLHRIGRTASITGEKLTEYQVIHASEVANQVCHWQPLEFLCFPSSGEPPHYKVLVESNEGSDLASSNHLAKQWAREFDKALGLANPEYADKCASGRLGPMRPWSIPAGKLQQKRQSRKSSLTSEEQVKAEVLTSDLDTHLLHSEAKPLS